MRINQFTIGKHEFKIQPFTAIQFWNISQLIDEPGAKSFEMLCKILCDNNLIFINNGIGELLTKGILDKIASDPETPAIFLLDLYNKYYEYARECTEELNSSKKK
jgi:hypothetical protein